MRNLNFIWFLIGVATATVFWFLWERMRPLWGEMRTNLKKSREVVKIHRVSRVEENHRRTTLRRAQGMHFAAPLFALNDIITTPRLLLPPPRVEPGKPPLTEDIVSQTIPYMPSWPELAAIYHAPTLELAQVVGNGINLLITGQPGIGKTTALAYLASLAANRDPQLGQQRDAIPFIYHVADLRLPESEAKNILNPIQELASEGASMLDMTRLPRFIELTFKNRRALLLLDGFDELAPDEQAKITEYLKKLLEIYPGNQVITTGCPEYLGELLSLGFEPMSLIPWNTKQREEFIKKWGQLWIQNIAETSWWQGNGKQNEEIDPLLINAWLNTDNQLLTPLELTLKVWAGYAGDSLGPDILDFIATHIRRLAPKGTPLAALETLGMQIALTSQSVFDTRAAREWVKNYEIPEEKEGIEEGEGNEEIVLENGEGPKTGPLEQKNKTEPSRKTGPLPASSALLNKLARFGLLVAHPDNRMRFAHPVFGGYLAGHALAQYNVDETLLQQPNWVGKQLTMRYIAAHGDASGLVDTMLNNTRMPLHQPLFITARWLRDAPHSAPWRGKVFAQLATLLQSDGLPMTLRGQAVAAFYWSEDPGAGPLFRQFLGAQSFELVRLATLGSGAIQDAKAVEAISSVIYAPSISVQRAGALALVAIGTTSAMEAVARALLHGEEDLRRAAAEAMANDPTEGYAMLKEGITLADALLRRAVIYGLARVHEEWATEALQNIQVDDDQWVVRNSASEVLESKTNILPYIPQPLSPPSETPWIIEFAGQHGEGIPPNSPATDVLLTALKNGNEDERLATLPYLKRTPSEGIITNLYHAMNRDDLVLREAIFIVLSELAASGVKLPDPDKFGLG